jgi:hypothetical protein
VLSSITICWAFCILLIFANMAAVDVWQAWLGQFTFTVPPSVALTEPLIAAPLAAPPLAALPDCATPEVEPLPVTAPVPPLPLAPPEVALPLAELSPLPPIPEEGPVPAPLVPGDPVCAEPDPDPELPLGEGMLLAHP